MPILATIQADAGLRHAFAERLAQGDLGPHRGIQMLSQHLTAMSAQGPADGGVDAEAVSLLLIGACFLRSWQRQMTGAGRGPTLPGVPAVAGTLARLLAPPGS
jgi:hypothetical protein